MLRLDLSCLRTYASPRELDASLRLMLADYAFLHDLPVPKEDTSGGMLLKLIYTLYKSKGPLVVLIDEYDKPILDHIGDAGQAEEIRQVLRTFYTNLKSCDEFLRFLLLTGISKFSKVGVFSALNNLEDVSMDAQYGSLLGYTQEEVESCFADRIADAAGKMHLSRDDFMRRLKDYYDGFCFDGRTRLYNPFSLMQCLKKAEFANYWYDSGSPSFIVNWMKEHHIKAPEEYRHIKVRSGFTGSQEIERADAASFLYQSGYLSIENKEDQLLTLDYPNREVLDSLSGLYLELIYSVKQYAALGTDVWRALEKGSIDELVRLYNIALAEIHYEYFPHRDEFWYRSLFLMLLRGAGVIVFAEVHTSQGRSDALISLDDRVIVLEFKLAKCSEEVERAVNEGRQQLVERGYAQGYVGEGRQVIEAVIVADDEKRRAAAWSAAR